MKELESGESNVQVKLLKEYVLEDAIINKTTTQYDIVDEDIAKINATYLQSYINNDSSVKQVYGGCYIDDNGKLNVLFTDETKNNIIDTVNIMTEDNIIHHRCEYSLEELISLKEYVSSVILTNCDDDELSIISSNIVSVGISEKNNRVVVRMIDCTNEKIAIFKKLVSNSNAIIFENSNGYTKKASLFHAGTRIWIQKDSYQYGYSIGFRCRYLSSSGSYYNGFLTSAHGNSKGDSVYFNDIYIGYILDWYNTDNGKVDAAFVYVTNSSYAPTNTLQRGLGTLVSGAYATGYYEGGTVYMVGGSSAYKSGKIISTSIDTIPDEDEPDKVRIRDCVEADYDCDAGDSGGIVYVKQNNSQYVTGLNCAGGIDANGTETSVFIKVSNIKEVFNITLY